MRLLSIHNLRFLLKMMEDIREAIENDTFMELKAAVYKKFGIESEMDKGF